MGQKAHPTGLRIGITENWRSRWYAKKKDFPKCLLEDHKIRKFVKKNYGFAGIPKIEIERTRETVTIIVYAANPGLIIGRRGANVEKLTEDLEKLIGKRADLRILEVKEPGLSAQLLGEGIAEQLMKRIPHRRAIRKAAETAMSRGAQGVRVQVSGRVGGAEIARRESLILGKIPLHTLRADIDYGLAVAVITKGTIGVKVWVYKGEILPGQEKLHAADAKTGQVPQVAAGKN